LLQGGDGNTEVNPNQGQTDPGANIGRLIMTGYLGGYDLSPAHYRANLANLSFAPIRWCPAIDPTLMAHFSYGSSYYMNPHWSFTIAGTLNSSIPLWVPPGSSPKSFKNSGTVHTAWFRRITDYPKTLAMLTEIYYTPYAAYGSASTISHPGPGNTSYWNILLPDGHVTTVTDNYLTTYFNTGANNLTNPINSGNGSNQEFIFDDALDILETEADGRNPANGKQSAMGLPGYKGSSYTNPKPGAPGVLSNRCLNYPSEIGSGGNGGGGVYTGLTNWGY
ncbi:MAG: hypothetical protein ABSC42_06920, partial [Tepidisphaeraceae bacterium]